MAAEGRALRPRHRRERHRAGDPARRPHGGDHLSGPALLSLRDLAKSYGALTVMAGVSLDVAEGEALGIIGPNGAGKTTLFALIAGDVRPDRGTVRLDGRDVTREPARRRCALGICRSHQIPKPFGGLTVFENLLVAACFARRLGEAAARRDCVDVLEQTGLLAKANRLAGTLTLLDRKRLEMARALATRPRLLLLDEIAGGLTEGECAELVAAVRDLHRAGTTVVWTEHVVGALMSVATRLVALDAGRVIVDGEPGAVMASPAVRDVYLGAPA